MERDSALGVAPSTAATRPPDTASTLLCRLVRLTADGNIQVRGTISVNGMIVTNSTIGPRGIMTNGGDIFDTIRQRCPNVK
jgi:hypothetical protein